MIVTLKRIGTSNEHETTIRLGPHDSVISKFVDEYEGRPGYIGLSRVELSVGDIICEQVFAGELINLEYEITHIDWQGEND